MAACTVLLAVADTARAVAMITVMRRDTTIIAAVMTAGGITIAGGITGAITITITAISEIAILRNAGVHRRPR
jgi:hypothetical protein